MTVVGYAFEEAWASLKRSGRSALMSIGTIAIAFTTLGGFLLVSVNVQELLDRWLQAAELSIYLQDDATDEQRTAIEQLLRGRPEVAGVEYVPRERALERFRADFPELRDVTDGVGDNPFPSAFEVRLNSASAGDTAAERLSEELTGKAGVTDVRYDRRWLSRLIGVVTTARIAGGLVAAILMLGAAFTVGAVVRLSLYARRQELEIMQLVGAPFSYIRGPSVAEGFVLGGIGAVAALLTVAVLYSTVSRWAGPNLSGLTGAAELRFLGGSEMLTLLLGGIVVGALAGFVASRAARHP